MNVMGGTPVAQPSHRVIVLEDAVRSRFGVSLQARAPRGVQSQQGKLGWILLWALGVPVPVLLVLFLLRGCT